MEATAEAIDRVHGAKQAWADVSPKDRLALLHECKARLMRETDAWVLTDLKQHGYDNVAEQAHLRGEARLVGPALFGFWLHGLIDLYTNLADKGCVPRPVKVEKREDGTTHCNVYPRTMMETVFAAGATISVVVESGKEVAQLSPMDRKPEVVGILAPGNYQAPLDVLTCLFLENAVCVYKPSPVNQEVAPHIARVFETLVARNFLAVVQGGAEVGKAIVDSAKVDRIVLTGGKSTYNNIVWGGAYTEGATPSVTKPVVAELGGVNPYIVTPGEWTPKQLSLQAQQLVRSKLFNGGHICASPQVVITCRKWPLRDAFLAEVRRQFKAHPAVRVFYPGCAQKYEEHKQHNAQGEVIEHERLFGDDQKMPLFVPDCPLDSFSLSNEAFSPVLCEVALDTEPNASAFLPEAVRVANDRCDGNLVATVIVDGKTAKSHAKAVETAIDQLRAGVVAINVNAHIGILFPQLPWGAHSGNPPSNVGSGIGWIGNSYCLEHVRKSVLRAPFEFMAAPKIPASKAVGEKEAARLTDFALNQSGGNMLMMALNSLFGI